MQISQKIELRDSVIVCYSQDVCTSQTTQNTLVELLLSIKALPMDTIVNKLSLVMKKPPSTDHVQSNARVSRHISVI